MVSQVSRFFAENMVAVFFVYGLAFFTMGLAVALETRRSPVAAVSRTMLLLAAFGILHSALEWTDMFAMISRGPAGAPDLPLQAARIVLLVSSTLALVEFGSRLLVEVDSSLRWLRWAGPAALALWVVNVSIAAIIGTGSVGQLFTDMDIWARYGIYFPGSVLAALALLRLSGQLGEQGLAPISRAARWAAVAFSLNAVVAGLVVPEAGYPLASTVNYRSFLDLVGVPPQVFRAVAALSVTVFTVWMLHAFREDHEKKLEGARQERFETQRQALQARREAQAQLEMEVAKRTEELRALHNIGTEISALLDLDKILESVVTKARQLLGADFAALSLLDDEIGEIRVRATNGDQPETAGGEGPSLGAGMAGRVIQLGDHFGTTAHWRPEDVIHHPGIEQILREEGLLAHMGAPLRIADRTIGLLHVAQRSVRKFSEGDSELLLGLANQAAIAIENAHLYEQVQSLAIMEERERIAHEMHDGLAQVFSFLNLELMNLRQLLAQGQAERANKEMDKMERALQEATADIRESILSLRTTISARDGLVPALRSYLKKYQQQTGVAAELFVSGKEVVRLSPPVEVQLLRIVQEALTNVRKHAAASRAWVTFDMGDKDVRVCVEDNGSGFDTANGSKQFKSYGLEMMRERTQTIGGTIYIDSAIGRGTKVDIRVPRKYAEER